MIFCFIPYQFKLLFFFILVLFKIIHFISANSHRNIHSLISNASIINHRFSCNVFIKLQDTHNINTSKPFIFDSQPFVTINKYKNSRGEKMLLFNIKRIMSMPLCFFFLFFGIAWAGEENHIVCSFEHNHK